MKARRVCRATTNRRSTAFPPAVQVTVQLCGPVASAEGGIAPESIADPELPDNSFRADILHLQRKDTADSLQVIRRAGCALCRYRGSGCGFDPSQADDCRDFTADAGLLGSLLAGRNLAAGNALTNKKSFRREVFS